METLQGLRFQLNPSLYPFHSNYFEDIECVRLNNSQIDNKRILQLYSLQKSHIRELHLDDNAFGNEGLLHLLCIAKRLPSLTHLSIQNTVIENDGIQGLCFYLQQVHSLQSVNICQNQFSSLLTDLVIQTCTIHYDCPISPHPANDFLQCRAVKDCCIILQLLAIQMDSQYTPIIPKPLLFNCTIENHRKIIAKLLQQPSLLAARIDSVIYAMESECSDEEKEFILYLLMKNFSLLSHYLLESVNTVIHVSSTTMASPISSPSLVPTGLQTNSLQSLSELSLSNSTPLSPIQFSSSSPYSPSSSSSPQLIEFDVVIGKEIQTTVGRVRRSGIVKLKVLQLFKYLMITKPVVFQAVVIAHGFNKILLDLYGLFPWNSLIHHSTTSIIMNEVMAKHSVLYYDLLINHKFAFFLSSQLGNKNVGYVGFLQSLYKLL